MTEFKEDKFCRTIDDMCNAFEESQQEVGRLERENTQLKAQLTWRPVSEPTKEKGLFLVKMKTIDGVICRETQWSDGKCFPWNDVISWLPIPPAPEGEVK